MVNSKFVLLMVLVSGCAPSILLKSLRATHQGWTQVYAIGGRTPAAQAPDLATTSASVTLAWNAMTSLSNQSLSYYNIYRATSSGGENYASPYATGISSTALTYTDSQVTPGTTYYYIVRPVFGTQEFYTTDVDSEIKIPVPPVNMVLVHRWMANQEICNHLMGRSYDRTNNYRCSYVGPVSTNGYYDLGQNQLWDAVTEGCNYTPPSTTASQSCGDSTNGCLNSGDPNSSITGGLTASGNPQVYYDRGSGTCYVWSSGTSWTSANTATNTQLGYMISNSPGLPPLVLVDQQHSWNACQQVAVNNMGVKRLPKHSEQIVAAAWSSNLSDTTIINRETGNSLPTTGNCNSNHGSGLSYSAAVGLPANLETLPGTSGSGITSVRTGSTSTANCVSMYGVQDLGGNVSQWSSDQTTCSTSTHSCTTTAVSSVDPTNSDWYWENGALPINFDGVVGPGGTSAGQTGPAYTGQFALSSQSFGATEFLVPLGIPLVGGSPSQYDALTIGTGAGQFNSVIFHSNEFWLSTDAGVSRGGFAGGDWFNHQEVGRFAFYISNSPTSTGKNVGFRCMIGAGI